MEDKSIQKHIVINGSVAVGKSHLQKVLTYNLSTHPRVYHEFIHNDPTALEIMRRRFAGEISALTFQNFILDKWFMELKRPADKINVYERLPDDAVEVFAHMSLDEDEYVFQLKRLEQLRGKLPSYKDMNAENTIWIRYDNKFTNSTNSLIETIEKYIDDDKTVYIVLEVLSSTAYANYRLRNRKEEFYTPEDLEYLYETYKVYTDSKIKEIGCEVIEL